MLFSVRPCHASLYNPCIFDPTVENIPKNMMEHPRYKYVVRLMAGLMLASTLSGCSIGMALSGHKDPNLQSLHVGSTKGEVELELGQPKESHPTSYGARTDIYEYEVNNEPSSARAVMYLIYDVLTIGIAEILFTPAELMTGEKKRLPIYYGVDGRVAGINETAPEMPMTPSEPRTHVVNLGPMPVQFKDLAGQLSIGMKGHHISRLAILPLADAAQNTNTPLGNYLTDKLTNEVYMTSSAKVIERSQLQKVINEQHLSLRAIFDAASVKRIGSLLGVDAVIMGTYAEMGLDFIEVNVRSVAVETAEVIGVGTILIPRASVEKLIR
jgi:Curli production assembly/transport component CsgG